VEAYAASHPCTSPEAHAGQRQQLLAALKADPLSPEAWLAFLSAEEAQQGSWTSGLPGAAPTSDAGAVTLYHLYFWATQLLQPSSRYRSNEAFIQLWLGFATQKW
jgi:hypothetical protein